MIINSIADYQVTSNDGLQFTFVPIAYKISGKERSISGTVPANSYTELDASAVGAPPYTVNVGYINESYRANPISVGSNDTLITFYMGFPAPPNGPGTFVFARSS